MALKKTLVNLTLSLGMVACSSSPKNLSVVYGKANNVIFAHGVPKLDSDESKKSFNQWPEVFAGNKRRSFQREFPNSNWRSVAQLEEAGYIIGVIESIVPGPRSSISLLQSWDAGRNWTPWHFNVPEALRYEDRITVLMNKQGRGVIALGDLDSPTSAKLVLETVDFGRSWHEIRNPEKLKIKDALESAKTSGFSKCQIAPTVGLIEPPADECLLNQ